MKKIIGDLRYDTDKATAIGAADNLHAEVASPTDFGYWSATLYITENGNYFLAGSGGPMSMFRKSTGQNSWGGSTDIIALDTQAAFQWAQRHLDVAVVEEFFGGLIADA